MSENITEPDTDNSDSDAGNYPTSRTVGEYIAKEHNAERVRYSVRRKGSTEIRGHLIREGTSWRFELPHAFGSLDEALEKINQLRL